MATSTYVHRLGRAHFAHLRAVVEGVPVEDAAARFLAADSRSAARGAHSQVVQLLRAITRRQGDSRWRLIGLAVSAPAAERPTLEQWADQRGIDIGDWGERELVEQYESECPPDRRVRRATRLRERQLQLLRELEPHAAQQARPSDLIEDWFDDVTTERLKRTGLLRLDELHRRIARSRRWYAYVPAIGATKASRIAQYLALLLPEPKLEQSPVERCAWLMAPAPSPAPFPAAAIDPSLGAWSAGQPPTPRPAARADRRWPTDLDGSQGTNRAPSATAGLRASNDRQAIEAWLAAKAGEPGSEDFVASTAKSYRIEAERLLLWCIAERHKPLSSMTVEDCAAYKTFIAQIPEGWISRRRAQRYQPGWTPFAGQLTVTSQQHALTVAGALFRWLVAAKYLHANPWELVKTRLGDDPRRSTLDSRAFTPAAWSAIVDFVQSAPPTASQARAEFVLHFVESVGLRADELICAELGALQSVDDGWVMQIHGKGARNRIAVVPPQAVRALDKYLAFRSLPALARAPANTPLVASVLDPMDPVSYRTLHDTLKSWVRRAIRASSLPPADKDVALRASLHWLRHTCGTRALERGVELSDLQGQFGHADPRTTMRYSKKQLRNRQASLGKAFA